MTTLRSFKVPRATRHFNEGQRVWVIYLTGSLAAYCCGRYRGRGRYVRAWVRWDRKNDLLPKFDTFEVSDDFARRHGLGGAAAQ